MIEESELLKLRQEISDTFVEFRLENGWNKRTAAFEVGIPLTNITRIENGTQDLHLAMLQKMAHAYGYGVEIAFIPLDEVDISQGEANGEDSHDVPEESRRP